MRKKRLVLDRDKLAKILVDPLFYATCPEFADMRESAAAAVSAYKASGRCEGGCGRDFRFARPAVDAFLAELRRLMTIPGGLRRVMAYMALNKDYSPDPVVIYYRVGKEAHPARITLKEATDGDQHPQADG